ncbi:MAG: FIST N-terminal domain-containing protein, partial [Ignavibacteriaceae bacterium]
MKAKSIKGKSPEEIQTELDKCMQDVFKPILAIVFLSISQDREAICNLLDKRGLAIFGASSNGEFINDEIEKNSTAIILLDIKPEYFTILFEEFQDRNFSKAAESVVKRSLSTFQKPAFLIAGSDFKTDVEEMISGFENVLGKDVNLFGGMAGDDYTFTEQFVFTNGKSSSHGLVALVLDENKIIIKGKATHGWKAVGTPKTVTKSEGNHVFTVDGVSVLELT